MIHHWECKRCTNQWASCCGGHMFQTPEQRAFEARKPYDLCDRCFIDLETSDSPLLHVLHLKQQLELKTRQLGEVVDRLTAVLGLGYAHKMDEMQREFSHRILGGLN